MSFDLVMSDVVTPDMEDAIRGPLVEYNTARFGESGKRDLSICLYSEDRTVAGGLIGWTARDWLYVQFLYIPEENRGHGLAGRLLTMAENEARARGCIGSYLDTMNPDALQTYLKYGYKIIGKNGPMSGGQFMHWLNKVFEKRD